MTETPAAVPSTPQAPPTEPQEIPFGQILTVFWRGRWMILACTLLGAIAGYLYVEQRGTIWRALSTVYVEKKGAVGAESLLLGIGSKNYANTQAEVMRSSDVIEGALKQYHIDFRGQQKKMFAPDVNQAIWLRKNLSIKVGRDDDIITVSLDSSHKEEACAIVRNVVAGYKEFQKSNQKDSAKDLNDQLEQKRLEQVQKSEQADQAAAAYRKANPGVGDDSGKLSTLQESWRADMLELGRADNALREAEQAWNRARNLRADPETLRQILPSLAASGGRAATYPPDMQAMTAQILLLQRERANLLVQLQPEHPRVTSIDDAITDLRETIAKQNRTFAEAIVAALEESYNATKTARDDLEKAVAAKQAELNRLDALNTDYRTLERTVARTEDALRTVNAQLQTIYVNLDTDPELTAVKVLQEALPETAEVASGKAMRLAAALLLGLFAGAGLAWLRGLMDQRIRTAEEVRTALQTPILAIMPRKAKTAQDKHFTAIDRWDASTHYAEAARSLRTAVYFGMADGDGNIVQVTSPDASDGKTTIASNLAIAMAKAGQRTLLVDADMRKPQQAAQFDLDNELGLSTLLGPSTRKFSSVVQKTDIPALHIMTSGPVPSNPAEMLNNEKFDKLLAELSEHYDRVIVDSPPVLPVADARIIATKCNVTILTLRVDKSTRKRASGALEMLVGVGAKILGIALNDMPHGIGYGYGAGYGYYGRYAGYGEPTPTPARTHRKNGAETPVRVRRSRTRREA